MTYRTKLLSLAALAFGSAALAGIAIGKLAPASGASDNPAVILPTLLVLASLVIGATWLWWQNTDDVQKQGQLVSWYWGGSAGAVVMLIALLVFTGRDSELIRGAGYLFFAQFAGFALVWSAWKLRGWSAAE